MSSAPLDVKALRNVFSLRVRGVRLVVPSACVAGVIAFDAPTRVPRTPPHILGLLPYGDGALAVVDLALFLDIGATSDSHDGLTTRRVVVTRHGELEAGLLCDQTHGVLGFESSSLEPPSVLKAGRLAEFVSWEFDDTTSRVGLLDVVSVLEKARVISTRVKR